MERQTRITLARNAAQTATARRGLALRGAEVAKNPSAHWRSHIPIPAIAPGPFGTPLTAQIKSDSDWYGAYADKTALKRWATADEIVGAILFLASDASTYVTGTLQIVDGGWTAVDGRFVPKL